MEKEKVLFNATLVFVENTEGKVLLGVKARKIGAGCWNGYGGGIEPNETPEQSALRELDEESGIKGDPSQLENVESLSSTIQKKTGKNLYVKCMYTFYETQQPKCRQPKKCLHQSGSTKTNFPTTT